MTLMVDHLFVLHLVVVVLVVVVVWIHWEMRRERRVWRKEAAHLEQWNWTALQI